MENLNEQPNQSDKYPYQMPSYGPEDDEYTYVSGFGFVPTPPDVAERQAIRSRGNALGAAFLVYFLVLSFVPNVMMVFFSMIFSDVVITGDGVFVAHPAVYELLSMVITIIAYLFPFLLIYRFSVKEKCRDAFPLRVRSRGIALLAIPICLAVTVIAMEATQMLAALSSAIGVPMTEELSIVPPTDTAALVLFYLRMTLLPAVMEEMVFRGVIFQSLRKFSDPMALFISAGLFSLAHMSVVKIPYTFLMGLCIGYFVMKTNSLLTGMAIHFVNNAYVLTKELIGSNVPAELLPIFQDISSIALIILGFVALLLLVNRYSGMFTLRPNSGYLRVYEQIRSFAAAPAMTITGVLLVMLTVSPYIVAIG